MGQVRARASALSCPGLQGGGVEGWIQLSKWDLKLGAGQQLERQRGREHRPKPRRTEQREKWCGGRGSLARSRSAGTGERVFPSLPDSRALGLGLWVPGGGGGRGGCGGLGERQIGSEHRGGRQVRGGPMTGPPSPALLPWGWGVCACLPAPVTSPSPSSSSFSPLSHPSGSVCLSSSLPVAAFL